MKVQESVNNLKVGDVLIAIDECRMDSDGRKTLTIGKEYVIKEVCNKSFEIIDDEDDYHVFRYSHIGNFFKIKQYSETDWLSKLVYGSREEIIQMSKNDLNRLKSDLIVKQVKDKYEQRSELGINKYNTTLQDNNGGVMEFLNHLQEELMDATLYIEKLKSKFNELDNIINGLHNRDTKESSN